MTDRYSGGIVVVAPAPEWAAQYRNVARDLAALLSGVSVEAIEHVGSTSVPGLPAKPILDIDIIVQREKIPMAIEALEQAGYVHLGDLGVTDREAFKAPDEKPPCNVYLCVADTLHVRNHLAVRDTLRARPDLRDRYGAVKVQLAAEPGMNITRYLAGKSPILQEILALSDFSAEEKQTIFELNTLADREGTSQSDS
jgi:GrpB-like predicted nucleotidyltransferase (UPF0157 family)